MTDETPNPAIAKFIPAAAANGVGRTAAYQLRAAGLLRTFKIGVSDYIELREFPELPTRLADPEAQARLAAIKRRASSA